MFTSGILDNGTKFLIVDKYYKDNDDIFCFELSKLYHGLDYDSNIINKKVVYCKFINQGGNKFDIDIKDKIHPFYLKCRLYDIQN